MLEFRLRNTRGQGNIAITFQPSDNNNYPEVLIPLTSDREGLRMAVPATSTGAKVALWGGIATCLTDTRVTYSEG